MGRFKDTESALGSARAGDVIVVGGGGLVKDFFAPMWEAICNAPPGVRLVVWGVGHCTNKDKPTALGEQHVRAIASRASVLFVRDPETLSTFESAGATGLLRVVGCPSILELRRWRARPKNVFLHVMHPTLLGARLEAWRTAAQNAARSLDLKYEEINHGLSEKRLQQWRGWRDLRHAYGRASMILTSRLHGAIMGSAIGTPVLPVSADLKIEDYWQKTLKGGPVLPVDDPSVLASVDWAKVRAGTSEVATRVRWVLDQNLEAARVVRELLGKPV
jgi:hypothetical protein